MGRKYSGGVFETPDWQPNIGFGTQRDRVDLYNARNSTYHGQGHTMPGTGWKVPGWRDMSFPEKLLTASIPFALVLGGAAAADDLSGGLGQKDPTYATPIIKLGGTGGFNNFNIPAENPIMLNETGSDNLTPSRIQAYADGAKGGFNASRIRELVNDSSNKAPAPNLRVQSVCHPLPSEEVSSPFGDNHPTKLNALASPGAQIYTPLFEDSSKGSDWLFIKGGTRDVTLCLGGAPVRYFQEVANDSIIEYDTRNRTISMIPVEYPEISANQLGGPENYEKTQNGLNNITITFGSNGVSTDKHSMNTRLNPTAVAGSERVVGAGEIISRGKSYPCQNLGTLVVDETKATRLPTNNSISWGSILESSNLCSLEGLKVY